MANELILIVEDNPKNLKLVRDTLQVKGYQTNRLGWVYEERVDSWRMIAYKHRADGGPTKKKSCCPLSGT